MRLLRQFLTRVMRRRREADLNDELRAFYEASVEAKLAAGMPRAQAERAARIELGSPAAVREWVGDVEWGSLVRGIGRDGRHAARVLWRSPGFTGAAVLILALGIGATTAIFSVVDAIVLRPLPIAEPERVVSLHRLVGTRDSRGFMYPPYERFHQATSAAFDRVSASGSMPVRTRLADGTFMPNATFVTSDYFELLGIRPAAGRFFVPDEHGPGASVAVVLTDAFWRARMASDPAVVGGTMVIAGTAATIVGIAPRGFRGIKLDSPTDLFLPLMSTSVVLPPGNYLHETTVMIDGAGFSPQTWLDITARLRPGVTLAQADALVSTIEIDAPSAHPQVSGPVRLVPTSTAALPEQTRGDAHRFAGLLLAVVALVLLLGCANLAGLLLARNEQRRRELTVRLALGARPSHVARLVMLEAAAVAVLGGAAGIVAANWLLQVMSAFVLPGRIDVDTLQIGLTWRILLVSAGLSVFTAITIGLLPALAAARMSILGGLQARGGAPARAAVRAALVTAQVAMSLVLLVGASLFVRSLQNALGTDIGIDTARVGYARVAFWGTDHDAARRAAYVREVLDRLHAIPGVESATVGSLPLAASPGSTPAFRIDGVQRQMPQTLVYSAGPNYFQTVGIPITSGRAFTREDHAPAAPPVVIVNEAFARQAWPGETPLGRRLAEPQRGPDLLVIGVAPDGKHLNLTESGRPAIYMPWHLASGPRFWETFAIRGARADTLLPAVEREIRQADSTLVIHIVATLEDRLEELAMTQRIGASVLGWFAVLALALAAAGVYGLIAFAVARRTGEIGIRLALGARPQDVVATMMRRSLVPVMAGVGLGLAGGYALTRLTAGFLFGIQPQDPLSFALGSAALILAAALAAYVPARRAARVDPVVALRAE
jgi:putative ABC transport system permease protein